MSAPKQIRRVALLTHSHPEEAFDGVDAAVEAAREHGVELVVDHHELEKHPALREAASFEEMPGEIDLCLVLGGDGTILRGLRTFVKTDVPVFGINYGTTGFLAAAESETLDGALTAALTGGYETVELPGLVTEVDGKRYGLNDVSFVRRPHHRVAELSYMLGGREVGHVRCDGLVASTPAGSTGYNLANGGPILAWGVEGYVVSFIAPHTLTARALVVAPDDILVVINAADRDPVDIAIDGRPVGALEPGAELGISFEDRVGRLAQIEGETFYRRIREKFGRLAH